jgi:hypothetical protein
MKATPIDRRLRDEAPRPSTVEARAAEVIRKVGGPAPLGPGADARILAALRRWEPGSSLRLQRFVLRAAFAVVVLVGAGMGAGASAWLRAPRPAPVAPAVTPAPAAAPPAPVAPLAPPPPAPEVITRAVASVETLPEPTFVRARLAIDPDARAFRPELPADFARTHLGQSFRWRVDVCVSATGTVLSARIRDHVHPLVDREVKKAILGWRYQAAQKAGRAVRSCLSLDYNLTVKADAARP